jgi:lipoprotein-releasing system ATP-binding protein
MIKAVGVKKAYGELQVLKGVNLEVKKGEVISIVGASGAGKTTFLQLLGSLEKPDEGQISINGKAIEQLKEKQLATFRNQHIGFVFQFHHLLPEFNALENVCIPAFIRKTPAREAEANAKELLNYLGLGERLQNKPSELSGGEQQRVAVARALINQPAVILADEPSGNLDSSSAKELHKLFFDLRDKFNQTFVIVTHNPELADMADRKLEMRDGLML